MLRSGHSYVDEAQDNLLIDAMREWPSNSWKDVRSNIDIFLVLRSLCRNPNGLFWAGDTAQTIAIGSSFRFNDLKAFLYRLEVSYIRVPINPSELKFV